MSPREPGAHNALEHHHVAAALIAIAAALGPGPPETRAVEPAITVFRDPGRYVAFPDVKRLPDGRLLCVFRDASFPKRVRHIERDARIVASISGDHGRTWSPPRVVYDDPACQNDPSIAVLADGRIALSFFNWVGVTAEHVEKHKPPHARRVDHGDWGDFAVPGGVYLLWGRTGADLQWQEKPTHVNGTADRLRATSSSILITSRGTLLLPTYGARPPEKPVDRAFVHRSTDAGETWSDEILIAADLKIAMREPALVETRDHDIIAMMRTADADDHLYMVRSEDDGRTWSQPQRTPLIGHPAGFQLLPDDRVLIVYGYRHDPFGVRACVSDDAGRTWNRDREFIVTDRGAHTDLGYPSACLTADNHLIVAYYMNGPDTPDRWIECKRIPPAALR